MVDLPRARCSPRACAAQLVTGRRAPSCEHGNATSSQHSPETLSKQLLMLATEDRPPGPERRRPNPPTNVDRRCLHGSTDLPTANKHHRFKHLNTPSAGRLRKRNRFRLRPAPAVALRRYCRRTALSYISCCRRWLSWVLQLLPQLCIMLRCRCSVVCAPFPPGHTRRSPQVLWRRLRVAPHRACRYDGCRSVFLWHTRRALGKDVRVESSARPVPCVPCGVDWAHLCPGWAHTFDQPSHRVGVSMGPTRGPRWATPKPHGPKSEALPSPTLVAAMRQHRANHSPRMGPTLARDDPARNTHASSSRANLAPLLVRGDSLLKPLTKAQPGPTGPLMLCPNSTNCGPSLGSNQRSYGYPNPHCAEHRASGSARRNCDTCATQLRHT